MHAWTAHPGHRKRYLNRCLLARMHRPRLAAILLALSALAAGCVAPAGTTNDGDALDDHVASLDALDTIVQQAGAAQNATLPAPAPDVRGIFRSLDHGVGEPTLAIASDGSLFVAAYEAGVSDILRTRDGGLTWDDVTPYLPGGVAPAHPRSFDPMVYVDPTTDRVFDIDQQAAVGCYQISHSDDLGDSWLGPFVGCVKPVVDHQTIVAAKPRTLTTVGYDNVVYVCYNIIATVECIRSLNGGISFAPAGPINSPGVEADGTLCSSLTGHAAAAPDGTMYIPRRACDDVYVIITRDDGTTWEVVQVAKEPGAIGGTGTSGSDPAIAIDALGNAYYTYIALDGHAYLSTSSDAGLTWSTPVDVTRAGVTATNLPKIAVGDEGRVALVYYGTSIENGYEATDEEMLNATWHGYLAIITDALTDAPTVTTSRLNDAADPLVRGPCGPGRCAGAILDFIDVEVDADGRAWAIFTDSCVDACAKPDGTWEQSNGGAGLLGTLETGPSLRAGIASLPPLPVAPEA